MFVRAINLVQNILLIHNEAAQSLIIIVKKVWGQNIMSVVSSSRYVTDTLLSFALTSCGHVSFEETLNFEKCFLLFRLKQTR